MIRKMVTNYLNIQFSVNIATKNITSEIKENGCKDVKTGNKYTEFG